MARYENLVDVAVPVRVAYDQWTQFETFPSFMSGVEEITQVTPTRTHWITSIGGVRREFDATITEQLPDERIAWRTDNGVTQAGVVTFHRLNDHATRVHVQLEMEPEGVTERVGTLSGAIGLRLQNDLNHFRDFVESRGVQSGGWRGTVERAPQENRALRERVAEEDPVAGHAQERPRP